MTTLEEILDGKIITILRGLDKETTLKTADALLKGGIHLIELPFDQTKPLSYTTDKIQAVCEHLKSEHVLVGAGTVLTAAQVQAAHDAGASYIITPTTCRDVIEKTKALGMVAMPGAMTPTEIEQCYHWGADIVKIFPSDNLGPAYIKAVRGPLGYIPMAAVGGVDLNNIQDFFKAGVCSGGIGGNIVNKKMLEAGEYDKITELAKAYIEKIQ